jgi:hypothetical protein
LRYFFHLRSKTGYICDDVGIEVEDLDRAFLEMIEALESLRLEDPAETHNWRGWSMEIGDSSGNVLLSFELDSFLS